MTLNNNILLLEIRLSCQKHPKTKYYIRSHLYLLKITFFIFGFEIDLLTLHMTLNHQTNHRIRLSRQNEILKDVLHFFLIIFVKNHISTFYFLKLTFRPLRWS